MKLVDIYNVFKSNYPKYVIMIKSGYFYEVYGDGANILNNLFGYNIKNVSGSKRVGFPLVSFNKVCEKLSKFKINYVVIDNNKCICRKKYNFNRYSFFVDNLDIDIRIDNIVKRIHLLKDNPKVNDILDYIERCL